MNLQNGYKVIYEKIADGERSFYASKTGVFADAELIATAKIGEYKLIYEKDGAFYGSLTGIPAEGDYCFEELKAVFEEGYVKPAATNEAPVAPVAESTEEPAEEPEEEPTTTEVDPEEVE